MPHDQKQQGFILMIVLMILLILAIAVFAFMRVRSGEEVKVPTMPLTEERIYGN